MIEAAAGRFGNHGRSVGGCNVRNKPIAAFSRSRATFRVAHLGMYEKWTAIDSETKLIIFMRWPLLTVEEVDHAVDSPVRSFMD